MIRVKVVPALDKRVSIENIRACVYYSCKSKVSNERFVFVLVPEAAVKRIVIWLNLLSGAYHLGFDYFSTVQNDYYDFQEVEDADLTFYV